jgi:hypothetical protein
MELAKVWVANVKTGLPFDEFGVKYLLRLCETLPGSGREARGAVALNDRPGCRAGGRLRVWFAKFPVCYVNSVPLLG